MSATTTKTSLVTLPSELMAQILGHLNPVDILSIRATCKVLAEMTFERLVWHNAFAEILDQNVVLHSTFDLASMTRKDLESATLRPSRFIESVLACKDHLVPTTTEQIQYSTPPLDDVPADIEGMGFSDAFLVGGGRFLVTSYMYCLIGIWDLDDPNRHPESMKPLASLDPVKEQALGGPTDWGVSVDQVVVTEDRKTVRIVVYAVNADDFSDIRLCVYEICPYAENPIFQLFRISSNPQFAFEDLHAFDGDRIAFVNQDGRAIVWDLNLDSSVTWHPEESGRPTAVVIKGSKLLFFHDLTAVEIYSLSELHFEGTGQHKVLSSVPSHTCKGVEPSDAFSETDYLREFRYYASQPRCAMEPITLVAYNENENAAVSPVPIPGLEVFVARSFNDEDRLEKPLLWRRASIMSPTGMVPAAWGLLVGESYLVMWEEEIQDCATILLSALSPFESRSAERLKKVESTVVMEKLPVGSKLDMFDFCPVSMRLVTLVDGKVHVMEYK